MICTIRIFIPPFISPFVLIADMDKDVMVVTTVVVRIKSIDCPEITEK